MDPRPKLFLFAQIILISFILLVDIALTALFALALGQLVGFEPPDGLSFEFSHIDILILLASIGLYLELSFIFFLYYPRQPNPDFPVARYLRPAFITILVQINAFLVGYFAEDAILSFWPRRGEALALDAAGKTLLLDSAVLTFIALKIPLYTKTQDFFEYYFTDYD